MTLLTIDQIRQRAYLLDIQNYSNQINITNKVVIPRIDEIKSKILFYRAEIDREFEEQKKTKTSFEYGIIDINHYPIGFCRQIRDKVFEKLQKDTLFTEFVDNGIILKEIYIILRDRYFQNAIQLGNLYIDVANDTVDINEAKLEICELNNSDFKNLADYDEYFKVAEKYLHITLYPNNFFPFFTAICPCLAVSENKDINLFMHQEILFYKDLANNFKLSDNFFNSSKIAQKTLPSAYKNMFMNNRGKEPVFCKLYAEIPIETIITDVIPHLQQIPMNEKIDYMLNGLNLLYQFIALIQQNKMDSLNLLKKHFDEFPQPSAHLP